MIEEFGTIISLSDDRRIALVQCRRQSACASCPTTAVCHGGVSRDRERIEALNEAGGKVDDEVRIVTSTAHFLRASFILYIIPIVGLLCGAGLGQQFGQGRALPIDPALLTALSGVAGLVLTFALIHRVSRRLKRESFMPRIVAVVTTADL
jgi:sigma-E factor negative regulatory protein RseC